MDDDELIAAVAAGDDTALRELFTRHAPWLAAPAAGRAAAAGRRGCAAGDVPRGVEGRGRATGRRGRRGAWLWVIARQPGRAAAAPARPGHGAAQETLHRRPRSRRSRRGPGRHRRAALPGRKETCCASCTSKTARSPRSPPCSASRRARSRAAPTEPAAAAGRPGRDHDDHPERTRRQSPAPLTRPAVVDLDRVWTGRRRRGVAAAPRLVERTAARAAALARPCPRPGHHPVAAAAVADLHGRGVRRRGAGQAGPGQPLRLAGRAGGRGGRHRLRLRPGDRPGVGAVVELRGQRPDGAAYPGGAVFALNAGLGLLASAVSGAAAALTFGWLLPMTAVSALALAVAVAARSAVVGAGAGVAAWAITVLASQAGGPAHGGGHQRARRTCPTSRSRPAAPRSSLTPPARKGSISECRDDRRSAARSGKTRRSPG